jgi:hypothetical protein
MQQQQMKLSLETQQQQMKLNAQMQTEMIHHNLSPKRTTKQINTQWIGEIV